LSLEPGIRGLFYLLLSVCRRPAPGFDAVSSLENTLSIYICYDIFIACQESLGGAHSGTKRAFTLRNPIPAGEAFVIGTDILLGTTGTESTLIHGSPRPEDIAFGKLRSAERTSHKAVTTTDAGLFVNQHDAIVTLVDRTNRTDCLARRIGTMHARYRNGSLTRFSLIKGNHPTTVDANGDMISFLTGGDTTAAIDAPINIA
jgi:hypothetical protein